VAQHQDLAVHAGVQVLAVAVLRRAQHVQVGAAHIHQGGLDAVLAQPEIRQLRLAEEGAHVVQAQHAQALLLQQLDGQDAVQSAGEERQRVPGAAGEAVDGVHGRLHT
jgi:hypothetical protein